LLLKIQFIHFFFNFVSTSTFAFLICVSVISVFSSLVTTTWDYESPSSLLALDFLFLLGLLDFFGKVAVIGFGTGWNLILDDLRSPVAYVFGSMIFKARLSALF